MNNNNNNNKNDSSSSTSNKQLQPPKSATKSWYITEEDFKEPYVPSKDPWKISKKQKREYQKNAIPVCYNLPREFYEKTSDVSGSKDNDVGVGTSNEYDGNKQKH